MNTYTRRLPAEWEHHQGTLLSFPHEGRDWPGKYGAIQWAFVELIRKVVRYEPVYLVIQSESHQQSVLKMLNRAHADVANIIFIEQDTNRSWMRDSGPIVIQRSDGKREALQFGFNGWAKYPNHKIDKHIPEAVAKTLNLDLIKVIYKNKHVILEGGAIEVNGSGTLITTEECLLDPAIQVRNPGFTRKDYEVIFNEYLGITNVIWLGDGIEGDDTHGHVDDICRFVDQKTVLACVEPNKNDKNHQRLDANLDRLKNARLENGKSPEIIRIPMPGRIDFENMRLPASYVNYLVTNGCILVPTFNDKNDRTALGIIAELFPTRNVIGINATDLIWGLGTLHCLSHEIGQP